MCDQIKEVIDQDTQKIMSEEFQRLNPDIQRSIIVEPLIDQLKSFIIKKYAQDRKKVIKQFSGCTLGSLRFNFDDTEVASCCRSATGNNTTVFIGDLEGKAVWEETGLTITSLALSPDSTTILCACRGNNNNLYLQNRTSRIKTNLVGHPESVTSAAFNSAGNKIVSGCLGAQNNLIVWDISDSTAITQQPLTGSMVDVWSVSFSRDGTKII